MDDTDDHVSVGGTKVGEIVAIKPELYAALLAVARAGRKLEQTYPHMHFEYLSTALAALEAAHPGLLEKEG